MKPTNYFLSLLLFLFISLPATAQLDEGIASFDQGEYKAALKTFRGIVKDYPDSAVVLHYLGMSYYKLNKKEEGLKHMKKAFVIAPGNLDIRMAYVKGLRDSGDPEQAVNLLTDMKDENMPGPERIRVLETRAGLNDAMGRSAFALHDYQTLADLQPGNIHRQFEVARLALRIRKADIAMKACKLYLDKKSDDEPQTSVGVAHLYLGRAYVLKEDMENGCTHFKAAYGLGVAEAEYYKDKYCK